MQILYINACVRKESRTRQLADLLIQRLNGTIKEVDLAKEGLMPLDEESLNRRNDLQQKGALDDEMFRYARDFASADVIVVAAPYWDLSFPASLKTYFEHINVVGITFKYVDNKPFALCSADKLFYVTTAGGDIFSDEPGFGYVKMLAENFYGIKNINYIKAEGLDIWGADVEAIMDKARKEINELKI